MAAPKDILIDGFTARLTREGLSASTVRQYRKFVERFLAEFSGRAPQDFSRDDVESYVDRAADGVSVSTTNLRIAALKRFYGYLVDRDIVTGTNPAARLKAGRRKRKPNDWLHEEEDHAFMDAACTPQERILVAILRHAGLRIGEAKSLRIADVDLVRGELRVRQSKTDSGLRTVPIEGELGGEILAWLDYLRRKGRAEPSAYLLATCHGTPMQETFARRLVKRVAHRAGVRMTGQGAEDSSISCHTLRRTFGSSLLNRGVRLETVSKLLGHSDVSTTQRHYAELLTETVREEFKAALGVPQKADPRIAELRERLASYEESIRWSRARACN